MTHEDLFHRESVHVRGYDVNVEQRASTPAIIQMMHEAAMQHVSNLKLSAKELIEFDLGWVLHQQFLEIFELPQLGQQLQVLTHPSGRERLFTYRDFHLYDEQGNTLARASSTWFLMNLKRRRIARYPKFIDEVIEASNSFDHLPRPEVLKIEVDAPGNREEFRVHYHDLDFNGHLSNYYYGKWMLDSLPYNWLKNHTLTAFNIQFKEECLADDLIVVEIKRKEEHSFFHRMLRNGKEIALAVSNWK